MLWEIWKATLKIGKYTFPNTSKLCNLKYINKVLLCINIRVLYTFVISVTFKSTLHVSARFETSEIFAVVISLKRQIRVVELTNLNPYT